MRNFEYECSVDILGATLWQDNESVNLLGLLALKQQWYNTNHCEFWNNWIVDVFDLNTANDFGLSVWSKILGIQLFATNNVSPDSYPSFGFDSNSAQNFDNGNFATDSNQSFLLSVEQKRIVLKLRFFQLVTRGAVPEINRFLKSLFPSNSIYVLDNNDMTITYVNLSELSPELQRAITELDLLPRPAAVGIGFITIRVSKFGFAPSSRNFGHGNFIGG